MLTIGKLGVTRGQLDYYEAQVAAGAEDYYAGRGKSPGRWRGRGAELIGLAVGGQVERSQFMRLMQDRHPVVLADDEEAWRCRKRITLRCC